MATADPRYRPEVVRLTARARSVGGIHPANTVCTAGITKPCMPQEAHAQVPLAEPGMPANASYQRQAEADSSTTAAAGKLEQCRCMLHASARKQCRRLLARAAHVLHTSRSRTWERPTPTRTAAISFALPAEPGVSRTAADHSAKDQLSTRSPPKRCAAQPPGTCKVDQGGRRGFGRAVWAERPAWRNRASFSLERSGGTCGGVLEGQGGGRRWAMEPAQSITCEMA